MNKVFGVELSNSKGCYCELDLPATDYELLDALEKLQMKPGEQPTWEITELTYYRYLKVYLTVNVICTSLMNCPAGWKK